MMCMYSRVQMHTQIYSWKLGPGFVLLAKVCPWLIWFCFWSSKGESVHHFFHSQPQTSQHLGQFHSSAKHLPFNQAKSAASLCRNRQTDKQTNRQTDKQTNRQTDKQTNRQTHKQTNRQSRRQSPLLWSFSHHNRNCTGVNRKLTFLSPQMFTVL